jgi:ParB family chromosome partitioning protein
MAATDGHIALERTVSSIQIGARHRHDLGDLDTLAASIDRYGLLQPITITPDGVLVCGARRLAAIRQLGWDTVRVWVRSGISDPLAHLLAEQDDNVLHKPLTQLEQAALYREITELLREDAERRQEATRFSSEHQPGDEGPPKIWGAAHK